MHLSNDGLPSYKFCKPPQKLLDVYANVASSLYHLIEYNNQQSNTLAVLRDTLFPRLLSGELTIRAAAEAVEDNI